jgi:class 3 adenylate cyclase
MRAAAPDMLAALYDAEARLWEVLADDPAASQFNETVKVVRAAIAKAEGRADG